MVRWNGVGRTTVFDTSTQLRASILATDIATAGTAQVDVFDPGLGGVSNALTFTITPTEPTLSSLSPSSAIAGTPGFSLTVNGTNFTSGSVVRWNGVGRTTVFNSSTQLRASILDTDIAAAGTAQVDVFKPGPGGGLSNALTFTIKAASTQVTYQVTSAPTFVINTGRAEVLGAVRITAQDAGPSIASVVEFLYENIGCDNDATSGIGILATGAYMGKVFLAAVANTPAGCVVSVVILGALAPAVGDFIEIQGVRGRVDLSPAGAPSVGVDIDARLNASPSGSSLFTAPSIVRVATSAVELTTSVQIACLAPPLVPSPEVTVTEGFDGAFVQHVASVMGTAVPADARPLAGGINNTQIRIAVADIPVGVTLTWPVLVAGIDVATMGTSAGGLELVFSTVIGTTQTVIYEFVTTSQSTSDITTERFAIVPTVTATPGVGTATAQVQMWPGLASESPAVVVITDAPQPAAAKPRFNDPLAPSPPASLLTFDPCNPGPTLTSMSPSSTTVGGAGFSLTVNGTDFIAGSVVRWNGVDRTTVFDSDTQLQASILDTDISAAAMTQVTVFNPGPGRGCLQRPDFYPHAHPETYRPQTRRQSKLRESEQPRQSFCCYFRQRHL